mmetsp:Transcript_114790/g.324417  ORF Transcript_114790/g.324417 Transcript_114790/m.324417 type:complete len:208 (-) Transcript_114790:304-927(-)
MFGQRYVVDVRGELFEKLRGEYPRGVGLVKAAAEEERLARVARHLPQLRDAAGRDPLILQLHLVAVLVLGDVHCAPGPALLDAAVPAVIGVAAEGGCRVQAFWGIAVRREGLQRPREGVVVVRGLRLVEELPRRRRRVAVLFEVLRQAFPILTDPLLAEVVHEVEIARGVRQAAAEEGVAAGRAPRKVRVGPAKGEPILRDPIDVRG